MNDGIVSPAVPCTLHSDGHATQEEAARHGWEWETENAREMQMTREEFCMHPAHGRPGAIGFERVRTDFALVPFFGPHVFLCKPHRTVEGLRQTWGFRAGRQVASS